MHDMPRKLPPYVYSERTRHKKIVFYFRLGKGKRTRLPNPAAPDFEEEYKAALLASEQPTQRHAGAGSLSHLISEYRQSSAYRGLSDATRKQRDNIFKHVEEKSGSFPYAKIDRNHIIRGREKRKETPFQSKNFLDCMRGLFRWALESEKINSDPTAGVNNPKLPKTKGFEIWTEQEIEKYRTRWQIGTRERVWLEVLIGTGARRGDAVTIGRQHIRGNTLAIRTMKEDVWAYPPVLPEMTEAVRAGPVGDMTFVVGATGRNLTKESFGNMFRKACNAAGVKKSAHGLRKYSATRFAEMGLSDTELESLFGWVPGSAMAAHYRKEAQRKQVAISAAEKIARSPALNSGSPHPKKMAK